jgi:hypothetical protein
MNDLPRTRGRDLSGPTRTHEDKANVDADGGFVSPAGNTGAGNNLNRNENAETDFFRWRG